MSKIGDFLFNNSYYKAVMHSYSEATRRYNNGLRVWRTMHPLVGKDYHSKEIIHKNIKEIEEVSRCIATTNKLLRKCKKAVEIFFYERGLELPQNLQYDEYKLIADNAKTIEKANKWITTTNRLLSEHNEAVEIFSRDKGINLNQQLRYEEYELIAREKDTIKMLNEKLCELRNYRSSYSRAYDLLANRIPGQISFEELYQFDASYLKSKTEFLHFYEENEKLCNLVLGESQHAIDSFSKDVIEAENFCLWYVNSLQKSKGPIFMLATTDCSKFKLKMEALVEGDELKRAILDSTSYGNSVKFTDAYTISDFYNLRDSIDQLGLRFNDLEKRVNENRDSIKAFNKEKSGKSEVYIDDYIKASTKGTALYNYIELYKDQQSARTTAKQIKNGFPLGFAALYGDIKDLGSCNFSLITKIIENKENIISEEHKKQEKERQRREREEEAERKRIKEQQKREEEERLAKENEQKRREEEAERQRLEAQQQEKRRLMSLCTRKDDWESFLQVLQENDIRYFYHFTDKRNIPSIKEHGGLYSWFYCREHNIQIPNSGGDQVSRSLDNRHGLQDYVRLSFCDDHPMMYRLSQSGCVLKLLKIKIEVALWKGVLFSNMNATDSNHIHGASLDHLRNVKFSATKKHYVNNNDPDFKYHQAEVMVKTFIPLEYIENL